MKIPLDIIQYRMERARESLEDAKFLFDRGSLNSAVNRIYYAVFYEISALLLIKELYSSRHSGVRAMFHTHFVKTGKASKKSGEFYSVIFEFRQKGDYEDFVRFDGDKIKQWLLEAEELIDEIDVLIQNELPGDNIQN